jgi:hypothetical protein
MWLIVASSIVASSLLESLLAYVRRLLKTALTEQHLPKQHTNSDPKQHPKQLFFATPNKISLKMVLPWSCALS